MVIRLFVIAIAPVVALGVGIYLTDRHDREPWQLLFKVFMLGALSVIPITIIQRVLLAIDIFPGIFSIIYTAFIVAGLTEEFFKRSAVIYGVYNNKSFNEKLDGIVYSVFASLGFAMVENIMYVVFRYTGNYHVGILRGILSVPAHMLFGITMGYYLSLSKYANNNELKNHYYKKSLLMPAILHGIFNFILMAQIPALMVLFIPYVIYLWVINLRKLNQYTSDSKDKFNRVDNDIEKK